MPIHTLTNISCTQFTSSRPNLTIFCPPAELPVLPPLNPGLVLVTILPLCKKKDGLLSYEKCTLSFGVTLVAVTATGAGGVVIVAVRHTDPYAAQERER
jgi:hypothetical protein